MEYYIKCPKCGDKMNLNTWGNSLPYYDCRRRGWSGTYPKDCDFKISVHEYEAKYQGEMSRLERISNKFNAGVYRFYTDDGREDMAFLIGELQRFSKKESTP